MVVKFWFMQVVYKHDEHYWIYALRQKNFLSNISLLSSIMSRTNSTKYFLTNLLFEYLIFCVGFISVNLTILIIVAKLIFL